MLVDDETSICPFDRGLLDDAGEVELAGEVKPELMESVCEISTSPLANTVEAGEQLRGMRRVVQEIAGRRDISIGSAGTHPFALWEDQRIVARPRYRDLISGLQFVARQEIIFGIHVHVGLDDPDKAVHVTNGMRVHVPRCSRCRPTLPFGAGQHRPRLEQDPDLQGFPPQRHPAALRRLRGLVEAHPVHDELEGHRRLHVPLVRRAPAPYFGTVEIRCMDSQTRVEHTLGIAALIQAMVKELAEHYEAGKELSRYPYEMLDENKWLAARHGLDGQLVDLPGTERVPVPELARRVIDRLIPMRRSSAPRPNSTISRTFSRTATGRPASWWSTRPTTTCARSCGKSSTPRCPNRRAPRSRPRAHGEPAASARAAYRGGYSERACRSPTFFVVCKNCGSEVSPYITECPYCGQRIRKRAPKLDRSGEAQPSAAGGPDCRGCDPRRSPASPPIPGPTPRSRCCSCALSACSTRPSRYRGLPDPAPSGRHMALVSRPFHHADQLGYAFVALVPVGIFGTLLERRFGPLVPVGAVRALRRAAGAGGGDARDAAAA